MKKKPDPRIRKRTLAELAQSEARLLEELEMLRNPPQSPMTDAQMRAWEYNKLTQDIAGLKMQIKNTQASLVSQADQLAVKELQLFQVQKQFMPEQLRDVGCLNSPTRF